MKLDSLALFRGQDQTWVAVLGPFLASETPSPKLPSFYCNNFELSDPMPWKIGQRQLSQDELHHHLSQLPAPATEAIHWQEPQTQTFRDIFQIIQQRIAQGELEKAVPAIVAHGQLSQGQPSHILHSLYHSDPAHYAYAFLEDQRGFCGLSPERLLRTQGRQLDTVALAGTARAHQSKQLLSDPKEIREHELVVGYLYDKLSTLGPVSRRPRGLRLLSEMIHLQSTLHVHLEHHWRPQELIAKLHPTPALGTQPRTAQALAELSQWRQQLHVPSQFGAPFGIHHNDQLEIVVSIRGIWWQDQHIQLPSGCGIIGQSQIERELRELQLKRNWVKTHLKLSPPPHDQ